MPNCQTRDLCHETKIIVKKKNEAQFLINSMSNDEIKKNQCKKEYRKDRCQLKLNS